MSVPDSPTSEARWGGIEPTRFDWFSLRPAGTVLAKVVIVHRSITDIEKRADEGSTHD